MYRWCRNFSVYLKITAKYIYFHKVPLLSRLSTISLAFPLAKTVASSANEHVNTANAEQVHHGYDVDITLQKAAIACTNTSIALLMQVVSEFLLLEETHTEVLEKLIGLTELNLQILGNTKQEDIIWDHILKIRAQLLTVEDSKQELMLLLQSVQQMQKSAAEAAHATGAEYAAIAASEHLQTSQIHLSRAREKTVLRQQELTQLEARAIAVIAKNKGKNKKTAATGMKTTTQLVDDNTETVKKLPNKTLPHQILIPEVMSHNDTSSMKYTEPSDSTKNNKSETKSNAEKGPAKDYPGFRNVNIASVEEDEKTITIKFEEEFPDEA